MFVVLVVLACGAMPREAALPSESQDSPSKVWREAVRVLVEEAGTDAAARRIKANFAERFGQTLDPGLVGSKLVRRLHEDHAIDAYVRWQLTSFDPVLPTMNDRAFRRLLKTLPPLPVNPYAEDRLVRDLFRALEAAPISDADRRVVEGMLDTARDRSAGADATRRAALGFREWVRTRQSVPGQRTLLVLLSDAEAIAKAGWDIRPVKDQLDAAFAAAASRASFEIDQRRDVARPCRPACRRRTPAHHPRAGRRRRRRRARNGRRDDLRHGCGALDEAARKRSMTDPFARYQRQMLLPVIGSEGQAALASSRVLVVGCGALGTMIVDHLGRAGVGTIAVVDRDLVELTNLQRQTLFDETDVAECMPKAEAARRRMSRINSSVAVEAYVADFNVRTAERLVDGADLYVDGLDNFETRYLLNDLAVRDGRPLVYGGAVATGGMTMTILPVSTHRRASTVSPRLQWDDAHATPCLRCVFPDAPPPGSSPTCDTAGVLGPAVAVIAAWQSAQAIKLLTGDIAAADRTLASFDVWTGETRRFDVGPARRADCPCCGEGRFEFIEGEATSAATSLCGRDAVQIAPAVPDAIDLGAILSRLEPHGAFETTPFMLRGRFADERGDGGEPLELTLFPDGRALIKGTTEAETARSIYARYIGA